MQQNFVKLTIYYKRERKKHKLQSFSLQMLSLLFYKRIIIMAFNITTEHELQRKLVIIMIFRVLSNKYPILFICFSLSNYF